MTVINSSTLLGMIGKVFYATSQDIARVVLSGALFDLSNGVIKMVSTDGHRLAMVSESFDVNFDSREIIGRDGLSELVKLANSGNGDISFAFQENHAIFKKDNIIMAIRLISGTFPNYEQVIPEKFHNTLEVEKFELTQSLKRVATTVDPKSGMGRLRFSSNKIELFGETSDHGQSQDEIDAVYSGDDIDIGLNIYYLLEAVDKTSGNVVQLKFNDELAPIVATSQDDSYIGLVMPMRL